MKAKPESNPLMQAWNVYRTSEVYQNTKKWASYTEHVDGSLWAAFESGWNAATNTPPVWPMTQKELIENIDSVLRRIDSSELPRHPAVTRFAVAVACVLLACRTALTGTKCSAAELLDPVRAHVARPMRMRMKHLLNVARTYFDHLLCAAEQAIAALRKRVEKLGRENCETCAAMTGERDRAIKERDSARIALAAANKIIGLRDEAAHVEHLRTQLAAAEHLIDRMIADAAAAAAYTSSASSSPATATPAEGKEE